MKKQISIGSKTIGADQPLFVIAECGVTCNYDMSIAKELIDVVRQAGGDAIKFILWFPDEIMSDRTTVYTYETVNGTKSENMFDMLQKLRFSLDQWLELKAYADQKGVLMFATVNSPGGIDYAERIGLEAYKLSSWDFNYTPLWHSIAALGKPMIIDTGPVNTLEVAGVLQIMKDHGNEQAALVHCFHTDDPAEKNMHAIPYMQNAFGTVVGFSSSGIEDETDIMAVSLGAAIIEKRLTLSRDLPGHHHVLSKTPAEFETYVTMIRDVQAALGSFDLKPSPGDLRERKKFFRHLVADREIPAGTVITADMLACKRPENGVSPEHMEFMVGRRTKRDLSVDDSITWEDLE